MLLSSIWGSSQVIISVNVSRLLNDYIFSFHAVYFLFHTISSWYDFEITVESYCVSPLLNQTFHGVFLHWMGTILLRVTPSSDLYSWYFLLIWRKLKQNFALSIFKVSSSPVDVPQVKYGYFVDKANENTWSWLNVSSPISRCPEKVYFNFFCNILLDRMPQIIIIHNAYSCVNITSSLLQVKSLLSSRQFSIMKIPVKGVSANLTKGITSCFWFVADLGILK